MEDMFLKNYEIGSWWWLKAETINKLNLFEIYFADDKYYEITDQDNYNVWLTNGSNHIRIDKNSFELIFKEVN